MTTSWAEFLQRWSSPGVDAIAYIITNLGSELFYTIAIPIIYWVWSKRAGYRLAVVFLWSMWLNSAIKHALAIPRPSPTDTVRVIHPETGGGYAFPSGHAQGSTTFWGQLAVEVRKKWFWLTSALIVALVSLSRIYLNVHWPTDVAGGIVIGATLVSLRVLAGPAWDRLTIPSYVRVAVAAAAPLILYAIHHTDDVHMLVGLLIGLPIGRRLEETVVNFDERAPVFVQVAKVFLGIAGFLAIRVGLKAVLPDLGLMHVFRYAVSGIWVSFGAPWAFEALGLSLSR